MDEGRLAVLSVFDEGTTKATPELASRRNDIVAALAAFLFVPHAVAGGKAEATARRALGRGQLVVTLDDDENTSLVMLGATPASAQQLVRSALDVAGSKPSLSEVP